MKRTMILLITCAFAFAVGCSGDEAKNAANDAAAKAKAAAQYTASDAMNQAGAAAGSMADSAKGMADSAANAASDMANDAKGAAGGMANAAAEMAGGMTGDAASACRKLAESGAWGEALDVCRTAHEMMPDDLGLEHAYQQAKAAAGN